MTQTYLDAIFSYHVPTVSQAARYESIRHQARVLANTIVEFCPDSRERSLALTNLQQAVMWANASIAINE